MSSHPNYPAGVSVLSFERGRLPRIEVCDCCERDMEFDRGNGLWYVDGLRIGDDLYEAPGGYQMCSQKCLSQYTYNKASEQEQGLMRLMARVCDAWLEETRAEDHIWCLQRSGIAHLVSATDLRMTDDQIKVVARKLLGDDYLSGKDDPPQWVLDMGGAK